MSKEVKDNIQKMPAPKTQDSEKQLAENVKKQKDAAKAIIEENDFCVVIAYKAKEDQNDPIQFANMIITSSQPQLPLLPVLASASETLNEQFNREIDGLKKNFAQAAKSK